MTAVESGAAIGVQFGGPQPEASHPTVEKEIKPAPVLSPEPQITSENNPKKLVDISPGSPAYDALVANGVYPVPISESREYEAGYYPSAKKVSTERMQEIYGVERDAS